MRSERGINQKIRNRQKRHRSYHRPAPPPIVDCLESSGTTKVRGIFKNNLLTSPPPNRNTAKPGAKGSFWSSVGELILPRVCPLCGSPAGELWCGKCRVQLDTCRIEPSRACHRCGLPANQDDKFRGETLCRECSLSPAHPAVDRMICCFAYHGLVSRAVVSSKYAGRTALIRSLATELAIVASRTDAALPDCLTFVPSHILRRFSRGGCSAERLTGDLAAQLFIHHRRLVRVTRRIAKQALLNDDDDRRRNVSGAFELCGGSGITASIGSVPVRMIGGNGKGGRKSLRGRHVGIVDDVVTSGATTGEIAGLLKDAGAAAVTVFAVARTIRR